MLNCEYKKVLYLHKLNNKIIYIMKVILKAVLPSLLVALFTSCSGGKSSHSYSSDSYDYSSYSGSEDSSSGVDIDAMTDETFEDFYSTDVKTYQEVFREDIFLVGVLNDNDVEIINLNKWYTHDTRDFLLSSVNIPTTIEHDNKIYNVVSIESLLNNSSFDAYNYFNKEVLSSDGKILFYSGVPGEYSIPSTVEIIAANAFARDSRTKYNLYVVHMPNSVKRICDYAFDNSLVGMVDTSVSYEKLDYQKSIDDLISYRDALNNYSTDVVVSKEELAEITDDLSENETEEDTSDWSEEEMAQAEAEAEDELAEQEEKYEAITAQAISIINRVELKYEAITDRPLILPSSIETVGNYAFRDCQFNRVELSHRFKMGIGVFYKVRGLKSVNIHNRLSIPSKTFAYCELLRDVNIDEGLIYIGDSAFQKSGVSKSMAIPSSVRKVSTEGFSMITRLSGGSSGAYNFNNYWTERQERAAQVAKEIDERRARIAEEGQSSYTTAIEEAEAALNTAQQNVWLAASNYGNRQSTEGMLACETLKRKTQEYDAAVKAYANYLRSNGMSSDADLALREAKRARESSATIINNYYRLP